MKMPSIDKICNIAGCVLIFVLLALLVFKPNGVMSLLEGQSPLAKPPTAKPTAKSAAKPAAAKPPPPAKPGQRPAKPSGKSGVTASNPLGDNEEYAAVSGIQTPARSCYPQDSLSPKDLLPKDDKDNIANFNKDYPISEGILKGVNFLEAGYQVGVNTVGQSLRNANRQVRSEPPNPQVNVSPWMNTTIGPDLGRAPLEIGEDCYASIGNNTL